MSKLTFSEAFGKYKAKLVNHNWAVSAIADDGAIVLSCWQHYLKKGAKKGVLQYDDCLSRWSGNALGNNLLREHLRQAQANALPVRLVIAVTDQQYQVDHGHNCSKVSKYFFAREDLVGTVVHFDGDHFVIDFSGIRP